tara:strand:+ start:69 stop:620 length:552 start_codon:yes stop_codon:yes gene_type:complete
MPDYQKGKIYKLWSPQGTNEEVYYGSTCDELRFRKNGHKQKSNYCSSKILFEKYDDVRIELVEDYPCNNKQELNKKEGEYIRENKCLNKYISGRTLKEYRQDNKEKIQEYHKNNKEKIQEYHKIWRENNTEVKKDYNKEYYENNKECLLNKYKKKVTCECGFILNKNNIKRHQKSSKHIKLME